MASLLRRFVPSDLVEVNGWLRERKHPEWLEVLLPEIGMIIPGMACGFLKPVEKEIAILVNFVSNPSEPSQLRKMALEGIGDNLLGQARERGIRKLILHTQHTGIVGWALDRKFSHLGDGMFLGGLS